MPLDNESKDPAHQRDVEKGDAEASPLRPLTPAAVRALAEAEERRKAAAKSRQATEIGGRDGPDPVRYGDWEVKGIASDF